MAATVRPLPLEKLPSGPSVRTPDQKYWASFTAPLQLPSHHASSITSITVPCLPTTFPPPPSFVPQDHFTITAGGLLQIYSSRTRKPVKTITRFDAGSSAHGAHIRRDGRVVAAGSDDGALQVFDVASRAVLKTWREGKQPVHVTRWRGVSGPLTDLMSCGDDRSVRLWDLTEDKSVRQLWGHQDYVRAGEWIAGPSSAARGASLIASGSYDQTVRLWDGRVRDGEGGQGANVMTFKLAAPVEAVLPMPTGTTLLASADNAVAVLDLVAARPITMLRNHQKTITSLALATRGTRVLTGALDGHVKIFDAKSWKVVAGAKYPSPILSLAVMADGAAQEDKHLLVGMQSGVLSIKTRLSGAQKTQAREKALEMQALADGKIDEYDRARRKKDRRNGKAWERGMQGKDFTGEGADIVVDPNVRPRAKRLSPWEEALRRGRYERALDLALATRSKPAAITVFKQLQYRGALRAALRGRGEAELLPTMKWLLMAVNDPRCVALSADVAKMVLELYAARAGGKGEFDRALVALHAVVRDNVESTQLAQSTLGMIELLSAGAAP